MLELEVSTTIQAPIDVVWGVLVDVERMPEWTPSMRSVSLEIGRALHRGSRARIKQPWLRAGTWTVDLFDPPRYYSWRSRTGSIETVGGHLLTDRGPVTDATLTIRHSGRGATLAGTALRPLVRHYLHVELRGLKTRAEEARK
jgi:uncharacterized membrane protein